MYLVMFASLRHQYPALVHILTYSVNLAYGPELGFKNKCRIRAAKWGPFTTLVGINSCRSIRL